MIKITTDRLIIRRFRPEDGEAFYDYISREEVCRYEPYFPYDREGAYREAARRAGDADFYAVTLRDGTLIGNIYFSRRECESWEIGYVFNPKYRGAGYATEACRAMIDHAFQNLETCRVEAWCCPLNSASWKLLERLGMRREAHMLRNHYFKRDENGNPIWMDTFVYAILKSEWN